MESEGATLDWAVREGLPEEVTFQLTMKEILCEPCICLSDFVSLICCGLLSESQCLPTTPALCLPALPAMDVVGILAAGLPALASLRAAPTRHNNDPSAAIYATCLNSLVQCF